MFTMALTSTVINPGEKLEHTATLDGDAYAAIKDKIHSMKAYITGTSESFNVNPDGYSICRNRQHTKSSHSQTVLMSRK